MERKKIVAIGVEGSDSPNLLPGEGALWIPGEGGRGTILFGLPERSEDDTERALRTASINLSAHLRQSIKEIAVEVDGNDILFSWKELFSNDLRSLQNGEAIVAPTLAKVFDRIFLFEKVEENGNELFFLRGERGRPSRLRGLHPTHATLVGREKEFKRLEELLDQVAVDQGQIAGIVGEAGIGKTRLLVALKEHLQRKSIPFAEGIFHVREGHRPYLGFAEIVSKLVGGKIETLSRWEMTDVETDFLRLFLEPGTKIERLAGLSENDIREGLFHAVRRLIHSAAKQPLVIILEDLHWADSGSIDLLERIMEGMESTRLLIVLAHRPDLAIRWKKRLNYNEIALKPFSSEEVENFLATSTGVDRVAARVRNDLFTLSIGNPFFAEEILRQFLDNGALEIEKGEDGKKILRAKETKIGDVPTTLHSLIAARFDRLDSTLRNVLRWASLLGSTFEAPELELVVSDQIPSFDKKAMTELFERGYLTEQSVFPRKIYQFQHDLILDVVRESVPDQEARRRHSIIVMILAKKYEDQIEFFLDRIADHALQSDNLDEAIIWSERAAKNNAEIFNYTLAERYYRSAINAWRNKGGMSEDIHALFHGWIQTLLFSGQHDQATTALEEWRNMGAENGPTRGFFFLTEASLARAKALHKDLLNAANSALSVFANDPSKEKDYLNAIEHRLNALTFLGKQNDVIHEGLEVLRLLGNRFPAIRFRIWSRMSYQALIKGEIDQSIDFLKKASVIESADISPSDRVDFIFRAAPTWDDALQFRNALEQMTLALRLAMKSGLRSWQAWSLLYRAALYQSVGKFTQGLADLEELKREFGQLRDVSLKNRSQLGWVEFYLELGSTQSAFKMADALEKVSSDTLTIWSRYQLRQFRANLLLQNGNHLESAREYRLLSEEFLRIADIGISERRLATALAIEAQYSLTRSDVLLHDYNNAFMLPQRSRTPMTNYFIQIASMELAAAGLPIDPPQFEELSLSKMEALWMKQRTYVSMIRLAKSRGEKSQADKLLDEYRKVRQDALKNIPAEYHESFLRHPEYSPEANGF